MSKVVAGTGHRPDKLGGFNPATDQKTLIIARKAIEVMQPSKVISGMALGWDTCLALAALEKSIPLIAAVPLRGFDSKWLRESREAYQDILDCADEIVYVDEVAGYGIQGVAAGVYHVGKLQKRNEWMVDNCDVIAALWNRTSGGTKNCIDYAIKKRRMYQNFWGEFVFL